MIKRWYFMSAEVYSDDGRVIWRGHSHFSFKSWLPCHTRVFVDAGKKICKENGYSYPRLIVTAFNRV